ncbi:MAG: hypothetical protein ABW142_02820 [Thermoleophilaceae bacterium]
MAADRIKRLKDLIDVVMQLPESPDRDRLLSEVRSRAVDLDTGVTPRAMLPVREPAPVPVAPRLPKRRTVMPPAPPRTPSPPPALGFSSTAELDWDKVLSETALLSLDDAPDCWPARQDDRSARPWTVGLRG